MRIMIIGAGSLGLLFASKLASLGVELTILTRTQEQAIELAEQGIDMVDMSTNTTLNEKRITACSYMEEIKESRAAGVPQIDYVFLMVKQTAITEELLAFIRNQMTEHTHLISFQNGIGHERVLGQAIGTERLLLAVTTEGAKRNGSTRVSHTGHGITYVGGLPAQTVTNADSQHILLIQLLEQAGFRTELSKNMEVRIWTKLAINAVINPLTAILRVTNGELLESEWTRSLMQDLFQEITRVATAEGIVLPDGLWDTIAEVCRATSRNHSSMLQDVEASRQTEIDYMNGSLLRMASDRGLELPTHAMIYRLIKAIEK